VRRLIYQVAVGEVPPFYRPCMASVQQYAQRIGADYIAQTEPIMRVVPKKSQRSERALRLGYLPIFEKQAAFAHLGEYDAIAIVDADIHVMPNAPDIFEAAGAADFAGVLERDLPLLAQYERKLIQYSEQQYRPLAQEVDWLWNKLGAAFYNMGLMVFSRGMLPYLRGQTPQEFIARPEFERFVNGVGGWRWSTDQTLMNYWVKATRMKTTNLPWRWNALYSYLKPEALEKGPFFVHFNLAANFPQKGAEIPTIIKRLTQCAPSS